MRNKISSLLRLIFALALVLPLISSQARAQAGEPPPPGGLPGAGGVPRFPPAPYLQPQPVPLAPAAARLPASRVAFESYRDGNYEIYLADDDGANLVRVTDNAGADITPRLNRGGTKIAFASNRSGNYEIYTANPDGSGLARLTANTKDDINPRWSPDGSRIAFQSLRDGNWEIYGMNADGAAQTRLTNNPGDDLTPGWSPDGSRIVWSAYHNGTNLIWAMNPDGSGPVKLSSQLNSENPSFSPDGTQIAYDADSNGDYWQEVWLMNADGSDQRLVYLPAAKQDALVRGWSPDGAWITYTHLVYVYQNSAWQWTSASLKFVSPASLPGVEQNLLGGSQDLLPDWQTLDTTPPDTAVDPLPAVSPGPFNVSWGGTDGAGSGLKDFNIQVHDGVGGVWADWLTATTATSASYPGIGGHTYYFRSQGRDRVFNLEPWIPSYDTLTTVEDLPPVSAVTALPPFSIPSLEISWSGTDPGGSGIKSYDLQVRDGAGDWTDWLQATLQTSAIFTGLSEHTYAFRVRAVDNALNQEAWPAADAPGPKTTLVSFMRQGTVTDQTGLPVVGAVVETTPAPFQNPPSGPFGGYATSVTTGDSTVSVNWSKSGYGSLPLSVFPAPSLGQVDVALPPADNGIADPGLEGALAAPWSGGGSVPPVSSGVFHTGAASARLGLLSGSLPLDGSSSLSQTVTLPAGMAHPVLSFFYQLNNATPANGGTFTVQAQGAPPLLATTASTPGWTHAWFDLSPWAGQEISLTFNLSMLAGADLPYALVDDVTVGSANPDLWIREAGFGSAFPSSQVTLGLAYGNQGSAPAEGTIVSLTLPDQLTYASADPAPSTTSGQVLTWDAGVLAGRSGPFILRVTADVAADAVLYTTLTCSARIETSSPELETDNNFLQPQLFIGARIFAPIIRK